MLSSARIGTASWRYYTQSVACAATEYYLGVGEAPGRWRGRGLAALGLEPGAVVGEAQLEALFARALHPVSGGRLGRRWRLDGVTGWDLTFSAPKSVSSLWALADPDTASHLRAAHAAAVEAALSYMDAHASWSRRGVDGTEQIASGGLAVACFEHRTSRCADPQLHTHALVVNKVRCTDGTWRTIDAVELFHHKKSAGMVYQAALRSEIYARTGFAFDVADNNGQSEIFAVPAGLLKMWSKRTAQIETEASARIGEYENSLGRSLSPNERTAVTKTAVLKTRPAKSVHDAGTLQERWYAEAVAGGFDPGQLMHAVREAAREAGRQASGQPVPDRDLAVEGVNAAAATRAVFSRADVAGQIAALLQVDGRGAAAVTATVEALTDQALGTAGAVSVGEHPSGRTPRASDARWAGAEVLAAEARVLSLAERGRTAGYGRVAVTSLVLAQRDAGLDAGQQEAVRALTQDGDFLHVVTAPAGAGKTRMLGVAANAWRRDGYRVVALAPSARAAAELAQATGGPADTLAKWIVEQDRRGLLLPEARARFVLDNRAVVVVDEASMANTHDLDVLLVAAGRAGAKAVLVGDPAQIGVVRGPGGMLAALANAGHGLDLATVHRFVEDWEAEASLGLRRGNPAVLDAYRDQHRLHPHSDVETAIEALHERWTLERAAGWKVLMMARTRADVDALNARARASAHDSGEVHGPVVRLGERDWQTGDLLRARRNDRTLPVGEDGHVRNGDRYRVVAVDDAGLHVEHLDRKDGAFLPAAYVAAHGEYGWATTVTAAQGATVDVGLVLVRPGIDREHLYVAMTRGRWANHAFVATDGAETDRHGPAGDRTNGAAALDVLATALARSGAQDAAVTARDNARARAVDAARLAAEEAARRVAEPVVPADHLARAAELSRRHVEHGRLQEEQQEHRRAAADGRTELARTTRLRPGRRRELLETVARHDQALQACFPRSAALSHEIVALSRQVDLDERSRRAEQRPRFTRATPAVSDEPYLAPARPSGFRGGPARVAAATAGGMELDRQRAVERRRPAPDHTYGRGRDDAPGIGW